MSITKLNNLSVSALTALPSGVGGKVLQVVSTQVTSTISTTITTALTFYDLSGLSATITPSSASNKILVVAKICSSLNTSGTNRQYLRLLRGSTAIGIGDSGTGVTVSGGGLYGTDTNSVVDVPFVWYDSPNTTSATTYKFQGSSNVNSQTFYINRGQYSGADAALGACQILLLEIAG